MNNFSLEEVRKSKVQLSDCRIIIEECSFQLIIERSSRIILLPTRQLREIETLFESFQNAIKED